MRKYFLNVAYKHQKCRKITLKQLERTNPTVQLTDLWGRLLRCMHTIIHTTI